MTIAQIVYDNERSFGYTDDDIHSKVSNISGYCLLDAQFEWARSCVFGKQWTTASTPVLVHLRQLSPGDWAYAAALQLCTGDSCVGKLMPFSAKLLDV